METEYSKRRSELQMENLKNLSKEFLGSDLVSDTDYEVENDGDPLAYKTENDAFMFVPQMDDPVMSEKTLRGQHP